MVSGNYLLIRGLPESGEKLFISFYVSHCHFQRLRYFITVSLSDMKRRDTSRNELFCTEPSIKNNRTN